ncbi:flagellar hook-basal body complex protein FliE [Marinomonas arenicola]|uniref:Flagellar hook-basal body complex protein FliE n=1 Tax=Marinomonas arenicola TaxID=569601 RepID=A0ABU9GA07_9GAMM
MVTDRPDINQVLSQMREMKAQVHAPGSSMPGVSKIGGEQGDAVGRADFADMLKDAVNNVNSLQQDAKSLAQSYERGDAGVDLPQVMIGLQKSSISFEAMTQVRNKLVDAYEKIMNMPI